MTAERRGGVQTAMRSVTCTLALLLAALAFGVQPASACSCAIGDPREALARHDAAFVGRLVEIRRPERIQSSADDATYVFSVERVVKGDLDPTVEVVSAFEGASCGIEAPLGERIGLFLDRDGDRWRSGLCQQIEPERLLAAARPLPAPNGTGPLALLVGGRFGDYRTLGLDAAGRTLAYGEGAGTAYWFSTCPGGRRVVEVAVVSARAFLLGVRDLRTFRLVAERDVPTSGYASPAAVRCAARDGSTAYVAVLNTDFPERTRILRLGPRGPTDVWKGTALAVGFGRGVAYVNGGRRGRSLLVVDLGSGKAHPVATIPPYVGALVPSPDGTALAGVAYSAPIGREAPPSRIVLVRSERRTVATVPLRMSNVTGEVVWLDRDRFTFFSQGEIDRVRTYDASLRLLASFSGWDARGHAALVGRRAFGIGFTGSLVAAELPRGPVRRIRELPSPAVGAIARVETRIRVAWKPPDLPRRSGSSARNDFAVAALAMVLAAGLLMRVRSRR